MKAFALAVVVTAGFVCSAGTADAQYRSRGSFGYRYVAPTYVAPAYNPYSYAVPSYYGGVVQSGYTPYVGSGVVITSGYTPVYSAPVYSGWNYYNPAAWAPRSYGSYPSYGRGWRW